MMWPVHVVQKGKLKIIKSCKARRPATNNDGAGKGIVARSARNVPSGEERGETDVFAG